jgi:hypothetical protein
VSLRNNPERIPDEKINNPSNCHGVFAMLKTFAVIMLKNPHSRRLILSTIIEKSRMIVFTSIDAIASSSEIPPIMINAEAPTNAIVALFILNFGYRPIATPINERIIIISMIEL